MLRQQDFQVLEIFTLATLFDFFIHTPLLFHSVAVLNEFVIQLVFNETVHHTGTNNEVALGDFIAHTSGCHEFDHDGLRRLHPIGFQLLIANTVKEHLIFVLCIWRTFTLDDLEVTFVVGNLRSDLAVQTCVKFGEGQLTLP